MLAGRREMQLRDEKSITPRGNAAEAVTPRRSVAEAVIPPTAKDAASSSADKPGKRSRYPNADAMLKAIGERMDAGGEEWRLLGNLWTGDVAANSFAYPRQEPQKARVGYLLIAAKEVRDNYQVMLHDEKQNKDANLKRSLEEPETKDIHNAWMNDVRSWMTPGPLKEYEDLITEANRLDQGKGGASAMLESLPKAGASAMLESLPKVGEKAIPVPDNKLST